MVFYSSNKISFVLAVIICLASSCKEQKEDQKEVKVEKPKLIMHQPSEMASLMNAMYAYNLQAKNQIIAGKTPIAMPLDLLKLHSAEMTKGRERTEVWNSFVNVFIEAQYKVLDSVSSLSIKERHNQVVNNCLDCHKTECVGPIPKIKKLLIQ